MAEQRQPFRFRLPWLSAANAPPPPPPRPPVRSQIPSQPTTAPIQRQPFRPAGIAPVQPPPQAQPPQRTEPPQRSEPQPPQRTEPKPPPPAVTEPQRVASQPASPSRSTTRTQAASLPASPSRATTESRATSQPASPSHTTQTRAAASTPPSPSRAAPQPRAASVPPSPTRTSQPQPASRTIPQPQSPSRLSSQPASRTTSQPSSPSHTTTQVPPTGGVGSQLPPPSTKLQPTIQESSSQPIPSSTQPTSSVPEQQPKAQEPQPKAQEPPPKAQEPQPKAQESLSLPTPSSTQPTSSVPEQQPKAQEPQPKAQEPQPKAQEISSQPTPISTQPTSSVPEQQPKAQEPQPKAQEPQPKAQESLSQPPSSTQPTSSVPEQQPTAQEPQPKAQAPSVAATETLASPKKLESNAIVGDANSLPETKSKESRGEKKVVQEAPKEEKTSGPAAYEESTHKTITELLTAATSGSGPQTKDLISAAFEKKQKQQERKEETSERKEALVTTTSSAKHVKTASPIQPKDRNTSTISMQKPAVNSNGEQIPLHEEIKNDISKFLQKLTTSQSLNETPVSVITIAGENRGASMQLGLKSAKKESSVHIHRGYKLNPDESSTDATTDGEGSSKSKVRRSKENPQSKAYVNSNTQSVNSSILFYSSVTERNPGVQLVLSNNQAEPIKPNGKPEAPLEAHKAEFNTTPAEKLTYQPVVRRRCLRGLFMEPSDDDSDPENPEKPRRHGCRYSCGGESKDKEIL